MAAAALVAAAACGDSSRPAETIACTDEFRPLVATMRGAVHDLALSGAAFLITEQGLVVCDGFFGSYGSSTTAPLVSAVKWLSAATILTLVDAGQLSLDDTVAKVIPAFAARAPITLRQLLSHTSGLPAYHTCMSAATTLELCVDTIGAEAQQLNAPGTQFRYGGAAYSVAGRMAEIAAGKSWQQIFSTGIAQPLGLIGTSYGGGANPVLSEGANYSTLADYTVFLVMIVNGGTVGGRQVLSPAAIAEMTKNQIAGAQIVDSPRGAITYGLGVWRDTADAAGGAVQVSSPGAYGFVPWVDFARKVTGVFMVNDDLTRTYPYTLTMMQQVRSIIDGR